MRKWALHPRRRARRGACVAAALTLAAASVALGQTNVDIIGLTQLLSLDPTLTGSGVIVGQPEADLYGSSTNTFAPNPAYVGQPTSLFTFTDDNGNVSNTFNPAYESSHADQVGAIFYGTTGSGVAPGVKHVDSYSADYFGNNIISNLMPIADQVVNQSFIYNESASVPLTVEDQQSIDTLFDNYIARYGTIIVSAVGNSGPYTYVNAPGTAYNGIGVAANPGPSSIGPTIDDGRSKPDITAPGGATSYTTPLVAGSAAILVEAGARGDGGSSPTNESDAVDARTVKALLLNGADKQIVSFSRTPIAPLDTVHGAGQLNIYNSYENLVGGQHSASSVLNTTSVGGAHPSASGPAITASTGWDFSALTTSSTADEYANYIFKPAQNALTATLAWERQFNTTPDIPMGINNLDLFLYDTTANRLIDYSTSSVDNVQDVYDTDLIAGDTYDLQVLKIGGTPGVSASVVSNSETYALAYHFASPASGAVAQPGVWNTGAGSWSAAASWYNGIIPQQATTTANFTDAISGPQTITLDGDWTLGHLNFLSDNSYTLAPGNGGGLVFDNGGALALATIVDSLGNHVIAAPIQMNSHQLITVVNASDTLTLSGSINGIYGLTTAGNGTVLLSGQSYYFGGTTVDSGTLEIGSPRGFPVGMALVNNSLFTVQSGTPTSPVVVGPVSGSGQTILGSTITPAYLRIQAGSETFMQTALTINANSTLDITDATVLINYDPANDPIATIRAQIKSGYNNDTWTGPGIISTNAAANPGLYAIGYADGKTDMNTPALKTQILLETTLAGDANLDGAVNFPDLLVVAQNYGKTAQDWTQGDFNYDGIVNFPDLLLIAQNYGKVLSANQLADLPGSFDAEWQLARTEIEDATVPEPGSVTLMVIGSIALLARRRR